MDNYNEKHIDVGIQVWQLNDVEVWVGWSIAEISKEAVRQSGLPWEDVVDSPRIIPRSEWDRLMVMDTDAKYRPRYTYSNMIMKDVLENVEMPYMLASTEY